MIHILFGKKYNSNIHIVVFTLFTATGIPGKSRVIDEILKGGKCIAYRIFQRKKPFLVIYELRIYLKI